MSRDTLSVAYAQAVESGADAATWRALCERLLAAKRPRTKKASVVWPAPVYRVTLANGWRWQGSVYQPAPTHDAAADADRLARQIYRASHHEGWLPSEGWLAPEERIAAVLPNRGTAEMVAGYLLPPHLVPEVATVELVRAGGQQREVAYQYAIAAE